MRFLAHNWFNLALIALCALAMARPELGAEASPLYPAILRTAAIALVFFLTGVQLRTAELKAGLTSYRLHAFSQLYNFVAAPALALALRALAAPFIAPEIGTGLVALAILPTTITSCVVFTLLARGNVAGAVFNAVAGNLAGVIISPALFALLIADSVGVRVDWAQLATIGELIVVPLAAGLALRRPLAGVVDRTQRWLPKISSAALLVIIFFAFTSAFAPASPVWGWRGAELAVPLVLIAGMHFVLLAGAWAGARAAGLDAADRRAALFVAPQKTIAMGLPLLHFLFAGRPDLAGLVSLPLIFYHPLQLLVAGPIAVRLASQGESE